MRVTGDAVANAGETGADARGTDAIDAGGEGRTGGRLGELRRRCRKLHLEGKSLELTRVGSRKLTLGDQGGQSEIRRVLDSAYYRTVELN